MELSIPASPSRLAGLRRAARASLREVQDEVADDVVLALNEVATNAVLHGSSGGQPIQVVVHITNDWVEASVLDHGPSPRPASQPRLTLTSSALAGGACGCWGGWSMRSALNASGSAPG
jgi:anti-sigma regulatory factor (Ser/Thr protein kinase)